MRLFTILTLFTIIMCSCKNDTVQFDPKEKAARDAGNLVVFCSTKGQKLAPVAAAVFNQKVKILGLPYYGTFRSTNPYNAEIRKISQRNLDKIKGFGLELSSTSINPLEESDIATAMSLVHLGAKPLAIKKDPRVNEWRIPDQITDLNSRFLLIEMMVDNLIQTLEETK